MQAEPPPAKGSPARDDPHSCIETAAWKRSLLSKARLKGQQVRQDQRRLAAWVQSSPTVAGRPCEVAQSAQHWTDGGRWSYWARLSYSDWARFNVSRLASAISMAVVRRGEKLNSGDASGAMEFAARPWTVGDDDVAIFEFRKGGQTDMGPGGEGWGPAFPKRSARRRRSRATHSVAHKVMADAKYGTGAGSVHRSEAPIRARGQLSTAAAESFVNTSWLHRATQSNRTLLRTCCIAQLGQHRAALFVGCSQLENIFDHLCDGNPRRGVRQPRQPRTCPDGSTLLAMVVAAGKWALAFPSFHRAGMALSAVSRARIGYRPTLIVNNYASAHLLHVHPVRPFFDALASMTRLRASIRCYPQSTCADYRVGHRGSNSPCHGEMPTHG